jgi:hypothetical protein
MNEADRDAEREGFRYLGSTKDRLWGKYIPDTAIDGKSCRILSRRETAVVSGKKASARNI